MKIINLNLKEFYIRNKHFKSLSTHFNFLL